METTKVIISRLISNHSPGRVWKSCGNHQSCHFQANFKQQSRQAMETMWFPHVPTWFPHVKTKWLPCLNHQSCYFQADYKPQSRQAMETTWFHMETTKVIVSRLISSHSLGKPWKPCGFHMETMKVIGSRLNLSHYPGKSLMKTMSFPHGNQVETALHEANWLPC